MAALPVFPQASQPLEFPAGAQAIRTPELEPRVESCALQTGRHIVTESNKRKRAPKPHEPGTDWTIQQLARAKNMSPSKVRNLFRHEEGVVHLIGPVEGRDNMRIPESVVDRVFARLSDPALQVKSTRVRPVCVVRLRDSNRRMPKKVLYVIERKTRRAACGLRTYP